MAFWFKKTQRFLGFVQKDPMHISWIHYLKFSNDEHNMYSQGKQMIISTCIYWYRESTCCICCSWYCPIILGFVAFLLIGKLNTQNLSKGIKITWTLINIGQFHKTDKSSFTDIFLLTADLMHLKCWHSMELVLGYFSFIQPRRVLTGWEQCQLTSVIWHFKMYVTFCIFSCLWYCKTISTFQRVKNNSPLSTKCKIFVYGEEMEKGKSRDKLPDQKYQEVFKACSVSIEQKPVENQITFIILKIFRAKFSI